MIPQVFQRTVRGFLVAISFLTIVPLGIKEKATRKDIKISIPFFPVAGLFIGFLLYVFYLIFENVFPPFLTDALIILLWVIITGAMHLDGVADTIDGFYAGSTRDEILRIMRDPHTGAMGTIGLFVFILLKFAGIHSLPQDIKPGSLLLVPTIARGFLFIPAYFLPYAREGGTGRDFVDGVKRWHIIIFFMLSILFVLPFGKKGPALVSANIFVILLFALYCKKKLNGLTGDCLGFLCETLEIISLIVLCAGVQN